MKRYSDELKAIRLMQNRSKDIAKAHESISNDIDDLKRRLSALGADEIMASDEFKLAKQASIKAEQAQTKDIELIDIKEIYAMANQSIKGDIWLDDILDSSDMMAINHKIKEHMDKFNKKYGLDSWDYAIASSVGLFAAMLDMLFLKAPLKPTAAYQKKVDGVFNSWVQEAFNKFLSPEIVKELEKAHKIGSADISTIRNLKNAPKKLITPVNHRLKSLSHDPILGFLFGVLDMKNGTLTVASNGSIISYESTIAPVDGSFRTNAWTSFIRCKCPNCKRE